MAAAIENELNLLPTLYEVIKSLEKEPHDVSQKINDLKIKLQRAREYVEKLPGIQQSKDEQMKQIDVLRRQLIAKTKLLQKYKEISNFDILSDPSAHIS